MIRATTPTHALVFEAGVLDDVVVAKITYQQDQTVVDIIWGGADTSLIEMDKDNNQILIYWDQDTVNGFRAGRDVNIQVRLVDSDGNVMASCIIMTAVMLALDDDVLGVDTEGSTDAWTWDYTSMQDAEQIELADNLGIDYSGGIGDWDTDGIDLSLCYENLSLYHAPDDTTNDMWVKLKEALEICKHLEISFSN